MSDFKLLANSKANGRIPVEKYRSVSTGLTIVIAQVDGPLVNGYFCLATEAHDDDGLPHTLEHLIFLGSEDYPYKGVLDLLANRCLSSGTNAWTDTDHTCYTMTTAGAEGFLNLMPIYLDHILYPTLTDAGFTTEVHHINGEGEDGGVVYCEMQGTENTGETRSHLEMLRAMYPGKCGYKSETGGIMKNLRESTSNKKVKDYHKTFYRPENLHLIITGRIEPQQVFDRLESFQKKINSKGDRGEFVRPWQNPVPALPAPREIEVPYPADEEDDGMINIAWRGPKASDPNGIFALMVLMEYLTETSVSPLQANFVEIDDPLASSVNYSFIENSDSTVYLIFSNVPRAKYSLVEGHLTGVMDRLVTGQIPLDMQRMETVIRRRIQEQLSQMENSPHDSIAYMIIGDVLYGNSGEDFDVRLNSVEAYKKLTHESSSFWIGLMQKYLINNHRLVVKGVPSIKLEEEMKKAEKERTEVQKESLGEPGLKEKENLLKEAMEINDKEAPDSVLRCVDVPSASSIQFHSVENLVTGSAKQLNASAENPVCLQFDQLSANFVYLFTSMSTKDLSPEDKMYLPLLLELLLESPVQDGEVLLPYEDVVAQLAQHFLSSSTSLGLAGKRFVPGAYSESAVLYLQFIPDKYLEAVSWVKKLLFHSQIVAERIKVLATKMENSISNLKRSGHKVVSILLESLLFDERSNIHASSILQQQSFLKNLLKDLEKNPEQVVTRMNSVRDVLVKPSNLRLHMAGDVELLKNQDECLSVPWADKVDISPLVVPEFKLTVKPSGKDHLLTSLGSCESAFFVRCVPAITNAKDDDLPALNLFLQYLTQCEGPMWRTIRGEGLAYGYGMYPSVSRGQLYLTFYRATHPVKAYEEAKRIATSYADGTEEFDATLLEAAKSSLIFELIEKEKTIWGVVYESVISSYKGVDRHFNREFLERIDKVTVEDLKRVGKKYIPPLFGSSARTAVVCAPVNLKEVQEGFKGVGISLEETNVLNQHVKEQ